MDALISFAVTIGVMLIGFDVVSKAFGQGVNKLYRRGLRMLLRLLREIGRSIFDFLRWALPHMGTGLRNLFRWMNT